MGFRSMQEKLDNVCLKVAFSRKKFVFFIYLFGPLLIYLVKLYIFGKTKVFQRITGKSKFCGNNHR